MAAFALAAGVEVAPPRELPAGAVRRFQSSLDAVAVYKRHEPGAFSNVPGWSSAGTGHAFVRTTHAFFLQCRSRAGACLVSE